MDKKDWYSWLAFRENIEPTISKEEIKLISKLHAKYFNHVFAIPCSCSPKKSRRKIEKWINELNTMFETQPKPRYR